MTDAEFFDAMAQLRVIATNVIGFYQLAEDDTRVSGAAHRLHYQAQVYAGGLHLAERLMAAMAALPLRDMGDRS